MLRVLKRYLDAPIISHMLYVVETPLLLKRAEKYSKSELLSPPKGKATKHHQRRLPRAIPEGSINSVYTVSNAINLENKTERLIKITSKSPTRVTISPTSHNFTKSQNDRYGIFEVSYLEASSQFISLPHILLPLLV